MAKEEVCRFDSPNVSANNCTISQRVYDKMGKFNLPIKNSSPVIMSWFALKTQGIFQNLQHSSQVSFTTYRLDEEV